MKELGLNSVAVSTKGFAAEILNHLMHNIHVKMKSIDETDKFHDYKLEEEQLELQLKEAKEKAEIDAQAEKECQALIAEEAEAKRIAELEEANRQQLLTESQMAQSPTDDGVNNTTQGEKITGVVSDSDIKLPISNLKSIKPDISLINASGAENEHPVTDRETSRVRTERSDIANSGPRQIITEDQTNDIICEEIEIENIELEMSSKQPEPIKESKTTIDDCSENQNRNPFQANESTSRENIDSVVDITSARFSENSYPRHLPLKLAIIGPSFSHTRYVANFLGQKFDLKVISIETIVKDMINWNVENRITDIRSKEILNKCFSGEALDEGDQIYLLQRVLLYNFEVLGKDDDYLDYLLKVKATKERRRTRDQRRVETERQKRKTEYWNTKALDSIENIQWADFKLVDGRGFILCDFPSNMKAAHLLEKTFGYKDRKEETQRESIDQVKGLLQNMYPTLVEDSVELYKLKSENGNQNDVDIFNLLCPNIYNSSIFDAVILMNCESEEIFNRAFETFVDGDKKLIRLRNHNNDLAENIDFTSYKFTQQGDMNAFTSYQDKLHFEREKEMLVRFYGQFKIDGSEKSILFEMKDDSQKKIIESMDFLDRLLLQILQNKNEKYQKVYNKRLIEEEQKKIDGQNRHAMLAEKRDPNRTQTDNIKEKIAATIQNYNSSNLNNKSLLPCNIVLGLWTDFAFLYSESIKNMLVKYHRQKLAVKMINSSIVERTLELLMKPDSYNAHLKDFVEEYNEFYLTYPDILHQDDVKSEFHWRSYY